MDSVSNISEARTMGVKDQLKQIQNNTDDKSMALLAQAMEYMVTNFEEFKKETNDNFTELKNNTKGEYTPVSTSKDHEKRIARLEKAALWVLGTTFGLVFVAVVGLVLVKGS